MSELENYKRIAEEFRRETEGILRDEREKEAKLAEDRKKAEELTPKIPADERELANEKRELASAKNEIPKLQSEINNDKRKLAAITQQNNQIAMKLSQALRGEKAGDSRIRELKEKKLR